MSHICKMTGMEAVLPCAAPQCTAYGDCASAYAKSQLGLVFCPVAGDLGAYLGGSW